MFLLAAWTVAQSNSGMPYFGSIPKYAKQKLKHEATILQEKTSEIPPTVLQNFYDSYIYDELGRFQGAYVGEIRYYATDEEIEVIISESSVQMQGTKIFVDYKPKGTRGCKANTNWICTLEGDVINN
jgi:hypothetical protein